MRFDRPAPGEELNTGDVTPAREAASVIVLRDSDRGPEVLLVQRNPQARFMGGAWVFPGGSLHPGDADLRATARRELAEEAGIELDEHAPLVPFSRWITPEQVKTRFDTWFFLAEPPAGAEPRIDGRECVDIRWIRPADALRAEELMLVFPTIKHLEQLAELESVRHAFDTARAREVRPVQPRVVVRDGGAEVLLPGDPGYDD
ncbi:MAG: NUDIX hydrolase [Thermoleophilaceae bacterium]|nr:NUDIX hydrolase [Thermoleophilaceae bacterium]